MVIIYLYPVKQKPTSPVICEAFYQVSDGISFVVIMANITTVISALIFPEQSINVLPNVQYQ